MDILNNLALGFNAAGSPENLMYCFIGALLGTFIGVLPGIGPTATIAMLLPLTYYLTPTASLIMLAGIYYGSQYGGSITAILVNLPGEVSSSVTAIDGYQNGEARQGRYCACDCRHRLVHGRHHRHAVDRHFRYPALLHRAAIRFARILRADRPRLHRLHGAGARLDRQGVCHDHSGHACSARSARTRIPVHSVSRWASCSFVTASPSSRWRSASSASSKCSGTSRALSEKIPETAKITSLMPSREDFRRSIGPILRGSFLGSILGVLPGGGSILSAFTSYAVERESPSTPSGSATAPLKALRVLGPPTMPARRPPSSRS